MFCQMLWTPGYCSFGLILGHAVQILSVKGSLVIQAILIFLKENSYL